MLVSVCTADSGFEGSNCFIYSNNAPHISCASQPYGPKYGARRNATQRTIDHASVLLTVRDCYGVLLGTYKGLFLQIYDLDE